MMHKDGKTFVDYLSSKKLWLILFILTYGIFWFRLPPQVPLYYSQVLKADRLANSYELLIIPTILYLAFFAAERFLYKLTLENKTMIEIVKFFLIGFAVFGYIIFVRILLLVTL